MKTFFASKRSLVMVALLCALTFTTTAFAEPASFLAKMFGRKPAVGAQAEMLKAEHGPQMILAKTLYGAGAEMKANALATEIRTKLRLPSFVWHKPAGDEEMLGIGERTRDSQNGRQYKVRYANSTSTDAYAVLVGEFTSTADPRIADVLYAVRTARPATLEQSGKSDEKASKEDDSNWLVEKTRALFWWQSGRDENLNKGSMGAAFVVRNPLLPDDFFQAPKFDKFVQSLNKQVKNSLLDCPGRYTVRVASFYGKAKTEFDNGSRNSGLAGLSDSLDIAADQANILTAALRRKGEEAYQFHDRFGSYVTIGSFNTLGPKEAAVSDFQFHPAITAIMREHCGYRVIDTRDPQTGAMSRRTSLKSLEKIPFDIDGKPMAVPRPESNRIYGGALLGGR